MQVAEELTKKYRLPMCTPITKWGVDHDPNDSNLVYKAGFWPQIMFVRDQVAYGLFGVFPGSSREESDPAWDGVWVVGEHTSKSVTLPVMYFRWMGLEFMFRNNFHDWNITVRSPEPLELNDAHKLFDIHEDGYLFFQGFPEDFRAPAYGSNDYQIRSEFSVALCSNYEVWTLMWLIKNTWHVEF